MFRYVKLALVFTVATAPLPFPYHTLTGKFFTSVKLISTSTTIMSSPTALAAVALLTIASLSAVRSGGPRHLTTWLILAITTLVYITLTHYTKTTPGVLKFNAALRNPLGHLHPHILLTSVIAILIYLNPKKTIKSRRANDVISFRKGNYGAVVLSYGLLLTTFLMSMWWAQQELFWGTFWNWDPVELSLLLLLAVSTLAVHALLLLPAPSRLQVVFKSLLNAVIVVMYLQNKSNLISSVHAFSNNTLAKLTPIAVRCVMLPALVYVTCKALTASNTLYRGGRPRKMHGLAYAAAGLCAMFATNVGVERLDFSYKSAKHLLLVKVTAGYMLVVIGEPKANLIRNSLRLRNHLAVGWAAAYVFFIKINLTNQPVLLGYGYSNWAQYNSGGKWYARHGIGSRAATYLTAGSCNSAQTLKNTNSTDCVSGTTGSTVSLGKKHSPYYFVRLDCRATYALTTLLAATPRCVQKFRTGK